MNRSDAVSRISRLANEGTMAFCKAVDDVLAEFEKSIEEPKSEPSYLERLPEAVREFVVSRDYYSGNSEPSVSDEEDREALARTIWEHRDAIFAAGEPGDLLASGRIDIDCDHPNAVGRAISAFRSNQYVQVNIASDKGTRSVRLSHDKATRMSRRFAALAIALASKGGAQ